MVLMGTEVRETGKQEDFGVPVYFVTALGIRAISCWKLLDFSRLCSGFGSSHDTPVAANKLGPNSLCPHLHISPPPVQVFEHRLRGS